MRFFWHRTHCKISTLCCVVLKYIYGVKKVFFKVYTLLIYFFLDYPTYSDFHIAL